MENHCKIGRIVSKRTGREIRLPWTIHSPTNLYILGGETRLNIPADRVLEMAHGRLNGVVIAGYDQDGGTYFASSYADGGEVLWLLEKLKKQLLEMFTAASEQPRRA